MQTAKTILLLEDDADLAEVVTMGLQSAGYNVEQCHSYDNIFQCTDISTFDLIILDGFLEGRDGRKILRQLKLVPTTKNIPVIFATIMSEHDLTELKPDFYLQKAYGKQQLLEAVSSLI